MGIQVLISAVGQEPRQMAEQMNLETAALIVNQCDHFSYEEYSHKGRKIRCYSMAERGVGLSRNHGLMRADSSLCLFSDEDIVYDSGYGSVIESAFKKHPEADMILFNVRVTPARRTYWNVAEKRIRWYNYGRYPAYSIAARTESLHRANVSFSLLFGGGARYSNGEDSLFLRDCLRAGLRILALPDVIGEERERTSTWFQGYHEKFFKDRGVLYHYLYGRMALPFSVRFLLAHGREMCKELGWKRAFGLMREGIREGRGRQHSG